MRRQTPLPLLVVLACGGTETAPQPVAAPASSPAPSLRHPDEVRLANIVQLTRDVGENAEAYWSPDGDELVFQSAREPYQCDQIFRMDASAPGQPTQVSSGKGRTTCAFFTHDDKRIIYSSTHLSGDACPPKPDMSMGYVWPIYDTYDIFSALPDGTDVQQLTQSPGYDAEATVCPVDGSIVFTSTRDGDLELYRMDADGKNVKRLTHTPGYDGGAFFSADCKQIVWRASRPKGAALEDYERLLGQGLVRPSKLEIFVANADGSDVRQVTYLGAASFAPFLHPSGHKILFSSNYPNPRGREFDIWSINVDGSGLERVTYAPGFDGFPMFSPDGKRLAFGSNRGQAQPGQTDVYVADWIEDAPAARTETRVDRVAADVRWLAADEREGRGVGTQGLARAADWIEEQFLAAGVAPGNGDSYRQSLEVPVAVSVGAGTKASIRGRPLDAASFVPAGISASGSATGSTIYLGYGISASEIGHDDYKGRSVRGKIAVIQRFVPDDIKNFDNDDARRRYSDPHYKAYVAREHGARGVIFVDARGAQKKEEAGLPALGIARQSNVGIPVIFAKHEAVADLVARGGRVALSVELEKKTARVDNVVGVVRGGKRVSGSIVIGAHYDHLGFGGETSLEPGLEAVHNGADDNASGTAALVEVARRLAAKASELDRDVYVVAFTAEELGLLGSRHFVGHWPAGLAGKDVIAMLNMDMVGRLRNNHLSILGGKTATEWTDLVNPLCEREGLSCGLGGSGYGPSDQMSFYGEGIPVLHFFTGAHSDYHKSTDDASAVHAVGVERVASVVTGVAEMLAAMDSKLSYQRVPAPLPEGDLRSFGASLGTIPDYGADESDAGMLLGGVRPGSAAEQGGMRKGDRLVRLGGHDIRTVRDLVYVLREAKPGQRVKAVVVRDGKSIEVSVTYEQARRRVGR